MKKASLQNKKVKTKAPGKKPGNEFILLLFVTLLAVLSGTAIVVFIYGIQFLEVEKRAIMTLEKRYDYTIVIDNANKLSELSKKLNITNYSKNDAILNILNKADDINKRYGGEVQGTDVSFENNIASLSIKIVYVPKSSDDFLNMINELTSSTLPMIFISQASILLVDGQAQKYEITMDVSIRHPYIES